MIDGDKIVRYRNGQRVSKRPVLIRYHNMNQVTPNKYLSIGMKFSRRRLNPRKWNSILHFDLRELSRIIFNQINR